ncbi:cytochrome d ubiquinol oxidase, subunit II [Beutenbergia cavernae DSM 12333]|uniref:Cytochrome d ubiquinol oxidase, subunit II n=1 Tax=Beutenbergia cavernae (strain ATCC BAA-8 / DSM 12333 / CCUG 43141 / JCM 11478 / NBRC 16432 / NCIMB 13614 / HKI 0122) TaxID=471853 RepID=C5C3H3_BEUC1|nr:cytochrome d ubiquinol oxidase subunit II [Beutenbergia cavernae]ACQ79872.1 cytochrome d ubiquinol oxidase, subunit II [Beutenbergia cavernae DSM 12333]
MDLALVWFVLIALLWVGYLVLEGFDFGVGMLMRPLAKDDTDRRLAINTIGPVWDGNEVWLIVAGGATFAAFPEWYATLFSGFYLPLLAILVALIVRGVAFEYRGKIDDDAWRARWDWAITIGSWVPAVLWGVAFANFVRGVPIDADFQMVGGLTSLLSPFALLGGVVTTLLFLTHGAVFLALKTAGDYSRRAQTVAARLAPVTLVVTAAWALWAQVAYSRNAWTWVALAVAALALVGVVVATARRREGWAFTLSAIAIASAVVLVFGSMFPAVMPSSIDPAFSLTISNASSTPYTLTLMTWVAGFLTPLVLAYQGWTYWVFRKRLIREVIPPHTGLVLAPRSERG